MSCDRGFIDLVKCPLSTVEFFVRKKERLAGSLRILIRGKYHRLRIIMNMDPIINNGRFNTHDFNVTEIYDYYNLRQSVTKRL